MSEPSVDKIKLQFLGLVCVKEEVQCVGQLTPVSPTLSFYGLNFKFSYSHTLGAYVTACLHAFIHVKYDFFLFVVGLLCKKLLFCVPELYCGPLKQTVVQNRRRKRNESRLYDLSVDFIDFE